MVRPINPGAYRFPCRIMRQPPVDDFGGGDQEPVMVRRAWMDLQPQTGSEIADGERMSAIHQFKVRTPWTPEEVSTDMFLNWNGHDYQITSVANVREENMELELTVVRR